MDETRVNTRGIEWAAGLFEGEGSIVISRSGNPANKHLRFQLALASTDYDVLTTFRDIVGGVIYAPTKRKNRKQYWLWSSVTKNTTIKILETLLPYLHERRREKASRMLIEYRRQEAKLQQKKINKKNKELDIIKYWHTGKSAREISSDLGVSQSKVYTTVRGLNGKSC